MGAELGATTSIFPSDNVTKQFMKAQGRVEDYSRLKADPSATYDKTVEIDISSLEPMIAKPHMPDNVVKLSELEGTKVQQVAIGSCTNSSYRDLMTVAGALKGKTVHPDVSLGIAPGSKQVMNMLALNGALADMVAAGARILESTCGPCIGMGQSPSTDAVSLRTFNRNFIGRSGTQSAQVHLVSPEVAIAAAISGEISDPRKLGEYPVIKTPKKFLVDDNMILAPAENGSKVEILRGPNIAPCPTKEPLEEMLEGEVILKVDDNITTDHIMPAGAKILPLRSNVPKISEHVFVSVDPEFPARAKAKGGGFIVGGTNYGQGSSREHAALAPMYLGVKAVITKSFARIHLANLTNFGIIPLTFVDEADYDKIDQGDQLEMNTKSIKKTMTLKNKTKGESYQLTHSLDPRAVDIIKAGGSLAYAKANMSA
jgi:aconitate hydratase